MFLPRQADDVEGVGVVLVDYPPSLSRTARADATGTATIEFDPVDQGYFWRIERMTTYCLPQAQPAGAAVLVYEGPQLQPERIRDGSHLPSLDIADEASPITIHPSGQLVVQWTGMTPDTSVTASVQYQLWRRIIPTS